MKGGFIMTAGLPAVSGLYGNNFNMQNYYNNPYFLQAYNSPNYNQMYGQQQMYGQSPMYNQQMYGQQATNTTPSSTTQLPTGSNVNFQGAQNAITTETKEENDNYFWN